MARLDPNPYPLPPPAFGSGDWRHCDHVTQMDALLEASRQLPDGVIEGAILRWQRGDGFAFYLVTKERPLTVQWIPYLDEWRIESALIRGLTKNDVLDMVRRERNFASLFAKKN